MNNENRKTNETDSNNNHLYFVKCSLFLCEYEEDNNSFTQNKPFSQVCDGEI
jgi:hypothetical protein